jgi:hypothetical protein
MNQDSIEEHVSKIDWNSLSHTDRSELILRQLLYFELTKKFVHTTAVYGSDVRGLLTSMFVVLVLSFLNTDIKNVILSLLGLQILFVVMSRISVFVVKNQFDEMKNSYLEFLKKKQ